MLKHLPVIALTAGALKDQHETALQRGMNAFVPKPFDVDQLLDTIVRLVHERASGVLTTAASATGGPPLDTQLLFDVDGAQRKWRRTETLVRHLKTFLREHCDDAAHMLVHLQAGQTQELMSVAHKLRGAAGALSLQRCMTLAAAIEESVQSHIAAQQVGEWVGELQQALQATAVSIEEYLQTHTAQALSQPAPSRLSPAQDDSTQRDQACRALLEQLRAGIRSDDPAKVEQHMPALAQLWPSADLQRLQTLLDTFDFEGVSQWIASIELEPENTK
jgi:HPt (histidine-containing phosphotransfer) domain-containing protein